VTLRGQQDQEGQPGGHGPGPAHRAPAVSGALRGADSNLPWACRQHAPSLAGGHGRPVDGRQPPAPLRLRHHRMSWVDRAQPEVELLGRLAGPQRGRPGICTLGAVEPGDDPLVDFYATGLPAPQGSHSAVLINGKPQVIVGGTKKARREHRQWREAVRLAAVAWREAHPEVPPLDEPVSLFLKFWLPGPESDRYRTRVAVKPDWDKLSRSVCDSLTDSGVIVDDGRIWAANVQCVYARPGASTGCRVSLWPRGAAELADREILKATARVERTGQTALL
jgi:Holliday junction resolvase RusA-like endonuclease